jgi:hypothetical protein
MPLLDHFHPPLSSARHWEAFHARWAAAIADSLNDNLLPAGYYAEVQVHVGSRVEVDVATFGNGTATPAGTSGGPAAAVATRAWAPPAPALLLPALFPDSLEVLVFNKEGGPTLVAAAEMISPGNKDRPEARRAFAAKCASYLQQGIGLMTVDIVTSRQANLHNELVALMELGAEYRLPGEPLQAVSYRPVRPTAADQIEVWPATLSVGAPLPLLPLPLDKGLCLPLDLEATYAEACQRSRLP